MKTKIFVTVGSTYSLNRLIKEIDLFDSNKFEIFAQIGETTIHPKNIKFKKFLDYEKMIKKINWADTIITHAGVGTIIDCLAQNKKIILFPRLKTFNEAVDDHQIEICKAFEKKYGIIWTKDEKLLQTMLNSKKTLINPIKKLKQPVVIENQTGSNNLKDYQNEIKFVRKWLKK